MLEVSGLSVRYGNVVAVDGVSLTVGQGEIVALIGPNGAGKTSTLRAISGLVRPRRAESSSAEPTSPDGRLIGSWRWGWVTPPRGDGSSHR